MSKPIEPMETRAEIEKDWLSVECGRCHSINSYAPSHPDIEAYIASQKAQAVREATEKLLVMNISDVAFAAGEIEGLTGKKDTYHTRRLETLERHLAELNQPEKGKVE